MNALTKFLWVAFLLPSTAVAQHVHGGGGYQDMQANPLLNGIEVVTGLAAAVMAFQAALAFREGMLGKGMSWVAVGMVIMAVGHIILVLRRLLHADPLGFLGEIGSVIAFSLAVFASFIASALGFWLVRRAAKG